MKGRERERCGRMETGREEKVGGKQRGKGNTGERIEV